MLTTLGSSMRGAAMPLLGSAVAARCLAASALALAAAAPLGAPAGREPATAKAASSPQGSGQVSRAPVVRAAESLGEAVPRPDLGATEELPSGPGRGGSPRSHRERGGRDFALRALASVLERNTDDASHKVEVGPGGYLVGIPPSDSTITARGPGEGARPRSSAAESGASGASLLEGASRRDSCGSPQNLTIYEAWKTPTRPMVSPSQNDTDDLLCGAYGVPSKLHRNSVIRVLQKDPGGEWVETWPNAKAWCTLWEESGRGNGWNYSKETKIACKDTVDVNSAVCPSEKGKKKTFMVSDSPNKGLASSGESCFYWFYASYECCTDSTCENTQPWEDAGGKKEPSLGNSTNSSSNSPAELSDGTG